MERTLPVDLSFVLAKIHGMRSRMYEHERLERLLGSRNMLELMRSVSPGSDFASHRHFERALVSMHVADLSLVARYLRAPHREVLDAYLSRYQVENLKVILRGWVRGLPPDQVGDHLIDLPPGLGLPTQTLLASRDLDAFLRQIQSAQLARGAGLGRAHFEQTSSTYFIEAGLDRAWLSRLLEASSALGRGHRRPVLELVRLEADQYQALFVLRSRINYDITPAEIEPLLITASGTRMSSGDLMELASRATAVEMLTHVPGLSRLAGSATWSADGDDPARAIESLQKAFIGRLYAVANRLYYNCVANLGAVLAFCTLKRMELADLIVLTESLRYDIPRAEIAERMMGST